VQNLSILSYPKTDKVVDSQYLPPRPSQKKGKVGREGQSKEKAMIIKMLHEK
jgi:hypothetical protein